VAYFHLAASFSSYVLEKASFLLSKSSSPFIAMSVAFPDNVLIKYPLSVIGSFTATNMKTSFVLSVYGPFAIRDELLLYPGFGTPISIAGSSILMSTSVSFPLVTPL
jgi:hypothetical protein